jgi:integrase
MPTGSHQEPPGTDALIPRHARPTATLPRRATPLQRLTSRRRLHSSGPADARRAREADLVGGRGERLDELRALVAELRTLLAQSEPRPVTLVHWRTEVIGAYATRRPTTRGRMKQALDEAIALAGSEGTTAALTASLASRLAASRPDRRASTTNGLLAALRAACGLASTRRWIDPGALAGACWRLAETDPPRSRHHGRAELGRVLAVLEERATSWTAWRLWALTATLAYTGARKNEILRARVADVDRGRGVIWIRPNGRPLKTPASAAPVPIPEALDQVLAGWLSRVGSEWLIPRIDRAGPWTSGTYGRRPTDAIKAAGESVGVWGLTPQSLRHSLATHLAGHWGLGPKQVQQVLRHTSIRTQDRYVHPDVANLVAAVRAIRFDPPR